MTERTFNQFLDAKIKNQLCQPHIDLELGTHVRILLLQCSAVAICPIDKEVTVYVCVFLLIQYDIWYQIISNNNKNRYFRIHEHSPFVCSLACIKSEHCVVCPDNTGSAWLPLFGIIKRSYYYYYVSLFRWICSAWRIVFFLFLLFYCCNLFLFNRTLISSTSSPIDT